MPWDDGLNPESTAYRIAADDGARIRVLAGPGTGKSFAIKKRITRLLEQGAVPNRVLAVTFTRMAAADLIRDIRSLGVEGADAVIARTLHAECFRILAIRDVINITGRHPRPLAAFEMGPLFEDLRGAAAGRDKRAMRRLVAAYESAWARLQHDAPGAAPTAEDQAFEEALVNWLRFHRCMLIGELVPFALQYLRDNPACPERGAYDHVLVDEYQDLNRAEQELAALLATDSNLIVVGDDDQSIYTFKNAHRTGIIEFMVTYADAHDHSMVDCQRCPRKIVSMANSLISRNTGRAPPPRHLVPIPANGEGVVEILQFEHHAQEVTHLTARIAAIVQQGVPPGSIVVLCQSRKYVRPLYDALKAANVAASFCYQEGQLDDTDATERMALLSLVGNREDRVALRYLIGYGSTTWLSAQWAKVRHICEQEGVKPWDVLAAMEDGGRPRTGCANVVAKFTTIRQAAEALSALRGEPLLLAWLPDPARCGELREIGAACLTMSPDCDPALLAEGIRVIIEEPIVPDEVMEVRLMSLHKCKGLSASVVVIAGCVEGLIPRARDGDATDAEFHEAVEESRRLLFVGISRVKASPHLGRPGHLIMSSSRIVPISIAMQAGVAGRIVGASVATIPSRFMRELGADAPAAVRPIA
jgi:DNA helicase-2/ATP-dependent DNA helicase PcrA